MADYRLTPAAERDLESTESLTTVWMRGATCDASSLLVTECSMLRIGGFNLTHLDELRCTDKSRPAINAVYNTRAGSPKRFRSIQSVAERKLAQLDAAKTLGFLRSPPGNRLETLKGDRACQHSIRINDQFRVCFVWNDNDPINVEIVDYH